MPNINQPPKKYINPPPADWKQTVWLRRFGSFLEWLLRALETFWVIVGQLVSIFFIGWFLAGKLFNCHHDCFLVHLDQKQNWIKTALLILPFIYRPLRRMTESITKLPWIDSLGEEKDLEGGAETDEEKDTRVT